MRHVIAFGEPCTPSKIICVGRNYTAHIEELGNTVPEEMVVFIKPNSALTDTLRSRRSEPVHYEGEIAFLVRDGGLAAVAFGLDLTLRRLQSRLKAAGLPWERAKAFDGAALFSEFVALPDPDADLSLQLHINGQLAQQGDETMMLYQPEAVLRELKTFTTLEDNDIIMTGTPAGVGEVISDAEFSGGIYAGRVLLTEATWRAR